MLTTLVHRLTELQQAACAAIAAAAALKELDALDAQYLGRKGALAQCISAMKDLGAADKPALGKAVNDAKAAISAVLEARRAALHAKADAQAGARDALDVTLPGRARWQGGAHPLAQTLREMLDIFQRLGFAIEEGPEIEDEWHNFDALNIPATHPARDVQDTFFIDAPPAADARAGKWILRTHTSPVQARVMQCTQPPVRFVAPGRVYRNERIDASHYTIFHQVEGLYVDRGVSFAQLKGTLLEFAHAYYGPQVSLRFRPGYFPFTEPSAEVDITCSVCGGKGCSVCKQTGWVEILGAGMVHPNVFRAVGYDPDAVTGFAFGMGVERIAMLKYGIDDIRLFYESDLRFLTQFA
jgi:phenylalanyl-tRNA synthetase alpha chain